MENEVLRDYFEKKADELLNNTSHYERVFVNFGKFPINIVKVFDDFNNSEINYIYNNETIKISSSMRDDIVSSLIELNYYPEIKLQELSSQVEANRKRDSLINDIKEDVMDLAAEFNPLIKKINLFTELYESNDIKKELNLYMLQYNMDNINKKINKEDN